MNYLNERELPLDKMMPLIKERLSEGGEIRISPKGTSMLPMLRQGKDSVVLSPVTEKLRKYDLPLYQRDDGKYILHRIIECDNDYNCIGDNQFDIEKDVKHEQIIALVSGFYREKRYYSVNNIFYKAYSRIWNHTRKLRKTILRIKNKLKRILKK